MTSIRDGLVQRRELEYVASRMSSVEMNGSFYSLQRPSTYRRMAEQTPSDFVIAVKGGRLHHSLQAAGGRSDRRSRTSSPPVCWGSGPKLGPLLWQLPADLGFDEDRLAPFLAGLPRSTTAAAELARQHDDKLSGDRVLLETGARPSGAGTFSSHGTPRSPRRPQRICCVPTTSGWWCPTARPGRASSGSPAT